MPSNFEIAFQYLVDQNIEGGYINDPEDPGGETKYGISKRSYPHLDIRSLTLDQAKEIYRKEWWDDSYDKMPSAIATPVFIMAINTGAIEAHQTLQQAINLILEDTCHGDLEVDGHIGPITISHLDVVLDDESPYPERLVAATFKLEALRYYLKCSDKRAALGKKNDYMRSWNRRVLA
jgi:lysozyme family protein